MSSEILNRRDFIIDVYNAELEKIALFAPAMIRPVKAKAQNIFLNKTVLQMSPEDQERYIKEQERRLRLARMQLAAQRRQ